MTSSASIATDPHASYARSARFYDLIYSWKDYTTEAKIIEAIIDQHNPRAISLLDVACGTGEHLKFLDRFARAGLDNNPEFVALARQKLPDVPIYLADMTAFDLGCRFDVITCLFSAIGYLRDDPSVLAFF